MKPTYEHTAESLEALAKAIPLCTPAWPCNRTTCKRCSKRVLEDYRDELEERIWNDE